MKKEWKKASANSAIEWDWMEKKLGCFASSSNWELKAIE